MYVSIIFLMSKVSLPPNSEPTEEMDFEEFDNDWEDGEQQEQERVVHNIKVAKS